MVQQPVLMWGIAAEKRSQEAKAKPKAKGKAKAKGKMKGKSESKPQESVFGALQLKEEQEEEEDDDLDGMELNAEDFQEEDNHES